LLINQGFFAAIRIQQQAISNLSSYDLLSSHNKEQAYSKVICNTSQISKVFFLQNDKKILAKWYREN